MKVMTRNFGSPSPVVRDSGRQLPAFDLPTITLDRQLWRGAVIGGAAAMLGVLLVQTLATAAVDNLLAAVFGIGGLLLIAAAVVARASAPAIAMLAVLGMVAFASGMAGVGSTAWLVASAAASGAGGVLAVRATPFASLFTGWAVFHGVAGMALVIAG